MALIASDIDKHTTGPINTTGAKLIVCGCRNEGSPATPITDSAGNTWQQLDRATSANFGLGIRLFYCINPTTSATHTFANGMGPGYTIGVMAFDNTGTITFDKQSPVGTAGGTSYTSVSSGSLTPAQAQSLVISFGFAFNSGADVTGLVPQSGVGWIHPVSQDNGSADLDFGMAYKELTSATAQTARWDWTTAGEGGVCAAIFAADVPPPAGPTLSSPSGTATGKDAATAGATTNNATGTLYAIASSSATPPTGPQIEAGNDHTGSAADAAGSVAVTSTGAKTIPLTSITPDAARYMHLVHKDGSGNYSNIVTSLSFTCSTLALTGSLSTQSGTEGAALSWTGSNPSALVSGNGQGTRTWTIQSAGGSGLSGINSTTGVVSGTLPVGGSYTLTLRVTDQSSAGSEVPQTEDISFTLNVAPTAPTAGSNSGVGANGATLNWTNTAGGSPTTRVQLETPSGAGNWADATGATNPAASGVTSFAATGLAPGTQYRPRFAHVRGGQTSAYAVGTAFTTSASDTTAPTLSSASGTGGTLVCSGSVSTNEGNGTLYTVFTASATAPSKAQVKLGQDHTGAAALRALNQAVIGTGSQAIASGAITAGTRYMHCMHEDTAGNQSDVASSASFNVLALAGFDLHTDPACRICSISGSLTGIGNTSGVELRLHVLTRANPPVTVASSGLLTTDSNGRLGRFTHASLVQGTSYSLLLDPTDPAIKPALHTMVAT